MAWDPGVNRIQSFFCSSLSVIASVCIERISSSPFDQWNHTMLLCWIESKILSHGEWKVHNSCEKKFFFPLLASALPDERSFPSNGFMTNYNFGSNQQSHMPTLLGSPTSSGSSSFGSPPAATTAFSRLPQQPTNRFYHQNNRTSSK